MNWLFSLSEKASEELQFTPANQYCKSWQSWCYYWGTLWIGKKLDQLSVNSNSIFAVKVYYLQCPGIQTEVPTLWQSALSISFNMQNCKWHCLKKHVTIENVHLPWPRQVRWWRDMKCPVIISQRKLELVCFTSLDESVYGKNYHNWTRRVKCFRFIEIGLIIHNHTFTIRPVMCFKYWSIVCDTLLHCNEITEPEWQHSKECMCHLRNIAMRDDQENVTDR